MQTLKRFPRLPEQKLKHLMLRLLLLSAFAVCLPSLPAIGQPTSDSHNANRKLKVGVAVQPPFCMQDEAGDWSGISVDLWKQIARKLNFDYEFKVSDIAGLVKAMDNHAIDLMVCPAFITASGEAQIDFSAPYFVDDTAIAINADQQPGFMEAARFTVASPPFLVIVTLIVCILLAGASVLWLLEHKGESEHYKGKSRIAFIKSLYWSLVVLSGRDFPSTVGLKAAAPATKWGRMFGLVWMVVGVALFSLFTASAASLLTSRQLHSLVTDWSDLQHLRVGTVTESDAQEYLNTMQIKSSSYATPLDLVTALSQHRIDAAVYGRGGLVYYAKAVFHNKVAVLPLSSRRSCMGLPLQQGSPLRKPINRVLLQIVESRQWPTTVAKYQDGG